MTPTSSSPSGSSAAAQTSGTSHEVHSEEHEDHGHSTAAWTAVIVIWVGCLVSSLAVVFPSVLWFVVGLVIIVAGMAAGKILAMAGYGAKASTRKAAEGQAELPGRNQHDSGTR